MKAFFVCIELLAAVVFLILWFNYNPGLQSDGISQGIVGLAKLFLLCTWIIFAVASVLLLLTSSFWSQLVLLPLLLPVYFFCAPFVTDFLHDRFPEKFGIAVYNDAKNSALERVSNDKYRYDIVIESQYTPYKVELLCCGGDLENYFLEEPVLCDRSLGALRYWFASFAFLDNGAWIKLRSIDPEEMSNALKMLADQDLGTVRVIISITDEQLGTSGYHNGLVDNESPETYNPTVRLIVKNDVNQIEVKKFFLENGRISADLETVKAHENCARYLNATELGKGY